MTLQDIRETLPGKFLPQNFYGEKIPVESGGSSGEPILTYFTPDEFKEAFVAPFVEQVALGNFPEKGNWLYLGPTGPHAVGKAACICAKLTNGEEPYSIDFDPRWAKKLPLDSMAAKRYLEHICQQAIAIFSKVDIEILFVTPPVLDDLCQLLSQQKKLKIKGVQLAGMAASKDQWQKWQKNFPNAQFLIGYGNSLAGVIYQKQGEGYYINSKRMQINLIRLSKNTHLKNFAKKGEIGQVVLHRLDKSVLYLNVLERDQAIYQNNADNICYLTNVTSLYTMKKVKKGYY